MDDCKETMSFRHNRTDSFINSQRLWQHTQNLHRFKPEGIPSTETGKWHLTPNNKSYLQLILLAKENSVYSNGISLDIDLGKPQAQEQLTNPKLTQCYFGGLCILFSFVITFFFFTFLVFYLFVLIFLVCVSFLVLLLFLVLFYFILARERVRVRERRKKRKRERG